MANFFDQFDGQPPAFSSQSSDPSNAPPPDNAANPFDKYDDEPPAFGIRVSAKPAEISRISPTNPEAAIQNTGKEGYLSGALKGAATGVVQGGQDITSTSNLVGEAGDWLGSRIESYLRGVPLEQVQKDRAAREAAFKSAVAPIDNAIAPVANEISSVDKRMAENAQYVPSTEAGKIAQAGVRGATSGALMGGVNPVAASAGFVGGAAQQGAEDFTNNPYIGMGAGVLAPILTHNIVGPALAGGVKSITGPLTEAGRTNQAAKMLGSSATDAQAALTAAQSLPHETIPGSKPNLAEKTGDIGLAQATKAAGIADPNFAAGQMAAAGEQNAARAAAIKNTASPDADVMEPSIYLNKQLSDIDAAHSQAIEKMAQRAKDLSANLPAGIDPEIVGSNLRSAVQSASDDASAARKRLYDLVDPDNNLSVVTAQAQKAAAELQKSIDPSVTIPSPIATPVIGMVANLGDVTPFNKLTQLDTTITGAMAQAKRAGDNVGHMQLQKLKAAVMDSINNAVDNQNAWEQAAIARGDLDPSQSIRARFDQRAPEVSGVGNTWRDSSAGDSSLAVAVPGMAAPTSSGPSLAEVQGSGGLRASAGDQGIQALYRQGGDNTPVATSAGSTEFGASVPGGIGPANNGSGSSGTGSGPGRGPVLEGGASPAPTFDEGAAERLNAAKKAHAEFAQTYRQAPVKPVLETNGFAGQYKMASSAIPAKAFPAGNTGYETTSAFLNAAKNSPEAVSAIQDMAMDRLRSLMKGSDSLDPRVLDTWKRNYGQALKAVDEASPGFSSRFDDVATATKALEDAQAARVTALKQAQEGAAGKLNGANTPDEVKARVGDMIRAKDGPTQIKAVLERVKGDENAVAGLRKAGAEKILDDVTNAGTSGGEHNISGAKLQTLLTKHADSIEALFGKEGLDNMKAIAADIERSQKALDNTRSRSGSDTGANIFKTMTKIASQTGHVSVAGAMAIAGAEAVSSGHLATAAGVAGLAGLKAGLGKLRANNLRKVNDIYLEALENPEVGKALLQTYLNKNGSVNPGVFDRIGNAAARSFSVYLGAQGRQETNAENRDRQHRQSGGRVGKSREFLVNRLIKLSELAKKDQQAATKPLLSAPDPLVVHALKLTGQRI